MVDSKEICETHEEIREGWATNFQQAFDPLVNPRFDQSYKQLVDADVEAIEDLCKDESSIWSGSSICFKTTE